MAEKKETKRIVIDWKTGVPLSLEFTDEGVKISIENDGAPAMFHPTRDVPQYNPKNKDQLAGGFIPPFGETTYAIDITGNETHDVFTIKWPTKEELKQGKKASVAINTLPADLVKAGFAKLPKAGASFEDRKHEKEEEITKAMANIEKMIGLEGVKQALHEQIDVLDFAYDRREILGEDDPMKPSMHMVFTGSPGTGKTTVAREVAKIYHALGLIEHPEVVEVGRDDLVAGYVGQSEAKTKEILEKAEGKVLFIDEAYALANSGSNNDFGKQVIDQLVAAMENKRDKFVMIVAGYPEPMKNFIESNPGLRSRFVNYIEFEDYGREELGEILDLMAQDSKLEFTKDAREAALDKVEEERDSTKEGFGNARVVRNLVELAYKKAAHRRKQEKLSGKFDDASEKTLKTSVQLITADDIHNVSLAALSKRTSNVGYDTSLTEDARELAPDIVKEQDNQASASQSFRKSTMRPSNDDSPQKKIFARPQSELDRLINMKR